MMMNLERRHPRWITPFQWSVFWQKQRVLVREKGLAKTLPRMGFHLGLYGLVQAGWFLDALWPDKTPTNSLDQSIFIVGHQRSGTTFLHRLLAANDWAHSLTLHEMLLPPSSIQWGIDKTHQLDQAMGGHLGKYLAERQTRSLGSLDHIHRVRLNEPEEDEFAMWNMYASDICINDDPALLNTNPSDMPRPFLEWSPDQQYTALMWYRACVQKKLQRVGGEGFYVGKNPRFSRCLPHLNTVFPEAKVIVLMRNPLETIPSRISLMRALWRHSNPDFTEPSSKQIQWILNNSLEIYLRNEADLACIPEHRRIIVGYPSLRANPFRVLEDIRSHLDLPPLSPELCRKLETMPSSPHRSKHHYDLQEFGLTERDIRDPLLSIFEKYSDIW